MNNRRSKRKGRSGIATTKSKGATSASRSKSSGGAEYSPLYCRYNGMMLGFFVAGAFGKATRERYPVLRERIHEFLSELDIPTMLPEAHSDFVKEHAHHSVEILQAVASKSRAVCDFALLGSLAIHYTIARAGRGPEAAELREQADGLMEKHGIPLTELETFAKAVKRRKDGSISLHALHTASLVFLRGLIRPLSFEKDTAFVVMPFLPEFRVRFPTLYSPLMLECGYRGIRAWGGIESEDYQELLFDLISKCGVVLAELTTNNPNVLHEIGLAQGQEETLLLLIGEKGKAVVPSNLAHLAVFNYETQNHNWQQTALPQLALGIALGKLGLEMERNPEHYRSLRTSLKPRKPKVTADRQRKKS